MKVTLGVCLLAMVLSACTKSRYYEKNVDLKERLWPVNEKPSFTFDIQNPDTTYSLYITVRNESNYPNANLYFTYYLSDSTGMLLKKELVSQYLFDRKSGKPLGKSGLGDIYSHEFPLIEEYKFPQAGKYTLQYEQFMRTDTLKGITSIGLRIEQGSIK